jgi:hypothetical protein
MQPGVGQVPLAHDLAAGPHTVWLRKRTEPQIGVAWFGGFVPADGNLLAPPALKTRRVVGIGSSSQTGYGADANVTAATMCGFDASQENAQFSYIKLLGDALDAESVNLSYSGKGITRNIVDGDNTTLPALYERSVSRDPNTAPAPGDGADVVVLEAGGDDLVGPWGAGTLDTPTFVSAYTTLLQRIRAREPHAVVFACLGAGAGGGDRNTLRSAITAAVQATNAAGDPNVFFFEFQPYDGSLGYGCDYHPNHATAALYVQQLLPQVKAKLGW